MSELQHIERIVTLEVDMRHLRKEMTEIHDKVDEMHALLLQAKGVRWIVLAAATIAGGVGSLLTVIFNR